MDKAFENIGQNETISEPPQPLKKEEKAETKKGVYRPVSRPYQTGTTVKNTFPGTDYQINVLILYALNNFVLKEPFELRTEDDDYGKFDDVVLIKENEVEAVQVKYSKDENGKYTINHLATEKGGSKKIQLYRYFDSWFQYKDNPYYSCKIYSNHGVEDKNGLNLCFNGTHFNSKFVNNSNPPVAEEKIIYSKQCKKLSDDEKIKFHSDHVFRSIKSFSTKLKADYSEKNKNDLIKQFLKKIEFVLEQKSVDELSKDIKLLFRNHFKLNNDVVYYAFYCKIKNWLRDDNVLSHDLKTIEKLFSDIVSQCVIIERLYGETKRLLSRIKLNIGNAKIFSRERDIRSLENFLQSTEKDCLLLHGESGIGKTCLIKLFIEQSSNDKGQYIFIDIQDYHTLATQEKTEFNFSELSNLEAIIIDSAEKLFNNSVLKTMIDKLMIKCKCHHKKLILIFKDGKKVQYNAENSEKMRVGRLNLDDVMSAYPHLKKLSSITKHLDDLLQIPFYLNLVVSHYESLKVLEQKHKIEELKDYLIELSVTKTREKNQRIVNKERYLILMCKTARESLIDNNIVFVFQEHWHGLANDLMKSGVFFEMQKGQYVFAHDLFYDWSINQLITREFNQNLETNNSFESFLQFKSLIHLSKWFKKNVTLISPYLSQLANYGLSDKAFHTLFACISDVMTTKINDRDRKVLGNALSYMWIGYSHNEIHFNGTVARNIFNRLLRLAQMIDSNIINAIATISPNQEALHQRRFPGEIWIKSRPKWKNIIINSIVESTSVGSNEFCQYHPQLVIQLINKTCFLPDTIKMYRWHRSNINREFGLIDKGSLKNFNASALNGPFLSLLMYYGNQYLKSIIDIINKSCLRFCELPQSKRSLLWSRDRNIIKIKYQKPNGEVTRLYGNKYLWGLYRNVDVSHGYIQSALMAIECWLFQSKNKKDLFSALDIIIERSQTVATISIVASLCMRYPELLGQYALSLFKVKEFYDFDHYRQYNEIKIRHYFLSSDWYSPIFKEEREASGKFQHRQTDLKTLTVMLQIYDKPYSEPVHAIIDEHHKKLSLLTNQRKKDTLWKKTLLDMDSRKCGVSSKAYGNYTIWRFGIPQYDETIKQSIVPAEQLREFDKILEQMKSFYEGKTTISQDQIDSYIRTTEELHKNINGMKRHKVAIITSAQSYLACALLNKTYDTLTEKNRQWCYEKIEAHVMKDPTILMFIRVKTMIETVIKLFADTSIKENDKKLIKAIIVNFLLSGSSEIQVKTCIAINTYLCKKSPNFINQCILAILKLALIKKDSNRYAVLVEVMDNVSLMKLKNDLMNEKINPNDIFDAVLPGNSNADDVINDLLSQKELIHVSLFLALGDIDSKISLSLFNLYLNKLIINADRNYFDLPGFRQCDLWGFPFKNISEVFLSKLPDDFVKTCFDMLIRKKNYDLIERLLRWMVISVRNTNKQKSRLWFSINYVLSSSNHIDSAIVEKILFDSFSISVDDDNAFIFADENFKNIVLNAKSIYTETNNFILWLSLCNKMPFEQISKDKVSSILNVIKKCAGQFLDVQSNIEIFVLVFFNKNQQLLFDNRQLLQQCLDILDLLKDNQKVGHLKEQLKSQLRSSCMDTKKRKLVNDTSERPMKRMKLTQNAPSNTLLFNTRRKDSEKIQATEDCDENEAWIKPR